MCGAEWLLRANSYARERAGPGAVQRISHLMQASAAGNALAALSLCPAPHPRVGARSRPVRRTTSRAQARQSRTTGPTSSTSYWHLSPNAWRAGNGADQRTWRTNTPVSLPSECTDAIFHPKICKLLPLQKLRIGNTLNRLCHRATNGRRVPLMREVTYLR